MFYPARIMLRHFLRDPDAAQELFECYIGIVDFRRYCITVFRQVDLMVSCTRIRFPDASLRNAMETLGFLTPNAVHTSIDLLLGAGRIYRDLQ